MHFSPPTDFIPWCSFFIPAAACGFIMLLPVFLTTPPSTEPPARSQHWGHHVGPADHLLSCRDLGKNLQLVPPSRISMCTLFHMFLQDMFYIAWVRACVLSFFSRV